MRHCAIEFPNTFPVHAIENLLELDKEEMKQRSKFYRSVQEDSERKPGCHISYFDIILPTAASGQTSLRLSSVFLQNFTDHPLTMIPKTMDEIAGNAVVAGNI